MPGAGPQRLQRPYFKFKRLASESRSTIVSSDTQVSHTGRHSLSDPSDTSNEHSRRDRLPCIPSGHSLGERSLRYWMCCGRSSVTQTLMRPLPVWRLQQNPWRTQFWPNRNPKTKNKIKYYILKFSTILTIVSCFMLKLFSCRICDTCRDSVTIQCRMRK